MRVCVVVGYIAGCTIRFFSGDLSTLKGLLSHQDDSVKVLLHRYLCIYVSIQIYTHMCVCTCIRAHANTYTYKPHTHTHVRTHTCMHTRTHTHTHTHTYTHTHTHIHTHAHTNTCTRTHTNAHTVTHTYLICTYNPIYISKLALVFHWSNWKHSQKNSHRLPCTIY